MPVNISMWKPYTHVTLDEKSFADESVCEILQTAFPTWCFKHLLAYERPWKVLQKPSWFVFPKFLTVVVFYLCINILQHIPWEMLVFIIVERRQIIWQRTGSSLWVLCDRERAGVRGFPRRRRGPPQSQLPTRLTSEPTVFVHSQIRPLSCSPLNLEGQWCGSSTFQPQPIPTRLCRVLGECVPVCLLAFCP